jgi:hypothetical protein
MRHAALPHNCVTSQIIASKFTANWRRPRTNPRSTRCKKNCPTVSARCRRRWNCCCPWASLKILANEKCVANIEVKAGILKITRRGDFIQLYGKFPRLTKKEPKARLKEIKRLLLAI